MSKLQEQGTFQTLVSFTDLALTNGIIPVPVHLSGHYDLTVQQLDIASTTMELDYDDEITAPFILNITSPNISSSLSNVQGWMFQIPFETRTHQWNHNSNNQSETIITQRIQYSILPSRQTFAANLSNQFILQYTFNKGLTNKLYPITEPIEDFLVDFPANGAIVITWAYKRI